MKKQVLKISLLCGSFIFGLSTIKAQDNLGNHIATQNLNMNSNEVDNVTFLDFKSGANYGIRFWGGQDIYSIKMGSSSDYMYGPVSSYAIKFNMWSNATYKNRGWTWGSDGQTPVAALNAGGTMQLAKDLYVMEDIGIGTTTPAAALHVKDDGTSNLDAKLEGFTLIDGAQASLLLGTTTGAPYGEWGIEYNNSGSNTGLNFWRPSGSGGFGNYFLFIKDNGNVGIGTDDPKGYKLAVKGSMIAEEVVVKLYANWPDYVFTEKYGLMSLDEVESYINENSHLPNVPSAEEVEEEGINLGEMDAILLQKIEELTLYVIDLKKENKKQQEIIDSLIK